jgi:hypothetical protein
MILKYSDSFCKGDIQKRVKAEITTDHSASSYGMPVIVLEDGNALDLVSWVLLNYRVVRASKREKEELVRLGLI